MSSYTDIYLLGCSYLECYARSNPALELAKFFPSAQMTNLTKGGTSFDCHERMLIETVTANKPKKLLLVWGLTYWNRFELPNTDLATNQITINQFNPVEKKDFNSNINKFVVQNHYHRASNKDYYIASQLNKIIAITGWLRSLGHEYLIFNQADDFIAEYVIKNKSKYQQLLDDPNIIDLENFYMNDWWHSVGIPADPDDLKIVKSRYAHTVVGSKLAAITTQFIVDHLRNNNENINS